MDTAAGVTKALLESIQSRVNCSQTSVNRRAFGLRPANFDKDDPRPLRQALVLLLQGVDNLPFDLHAVLLHGVYDLLRLCFLCTGFLAKHGSQVA